MNRLVKQLIIAGLLVLLALLWPSTRARDNDIDIDRVLSHAIRITSRSWEYGALAEAMLELQNPELTVYSKDPFPDGYMPVLRDISKVPGLQYVRDLIWTNDSNTLIDGEGAFAHTLSFTVGIRKLLTNLTASHQVLPQTRHP